MIARIIKAVLFRVRRFFAKDHDRYLKKVKGVIHVGANTGQEIELYEKYKLPVIWIEPIPEVFQVLKKNIAGHLKQYAWEALVTDMNNKVYEFHVASNFGASSSILELDLHKDIWPDINYEKTIKLKSITLDTLIEINKLDMSKYDTLIMDTQGSELLVLKGVESNLKYFTFVKTEVSDFESYKGCCQLKDIEAFLFQRGFEEYSRNKFIDHPQGGSYFDVIYKRKAS